MEEILVTFASASALMLEGVVAVLVVYGAIEALARMAVHLVVQNEHATRRLIWMRFAQWFILSLEFALGADIIRTAISPSWDDVGKLAAIAAIRTGLSFFLERDIEVFDEAGKTNVAAD